MAASKGLVQLAKALKLIDVVPVNQANLKRFNLPFKEGGEYISKEKGVLTGKNVGIAKVEIDPLMEIRGGRPMATMKVEKLDVPEVGSKEGTNIKVNLVKPTSTGKTAGWKWLEVPESLKNVNTLVSVVKGNKHFFTLKTDFTKGANLKTYPKSKDEPRLRPTVKGNLDFGKVIGKINYRGKEHPVYDTIKTFKSGGIIRNPYDSI